MNEYDKKRLEASLECCELLKKYFEKYPMLRFNQVVDNFKVLNYKLYPESFFYEEPWITAEKLKKFLEL